MKDAILEAMRAHAIPGGSKGLWVVRKQEIKTPVVRSNDGGVHKITPGTYTMLNCYTDATLHEGGEVVMIDAPEELKKHLQFILMAQGSVLKTGLGLGCVVRGLLANPRVTHVTVIEKEQAVIDLVWPFMPHDRVTLIKANALNWCAVSKRRFDCAWHDIWSDECRGRPNLQLLHGRLLARMRDRVRFQGAWNFPRRFRRIFSEEAKVI